MTTATDMLAKYLAAESEILGTGKSTQFGDRQLTRENLAEIRAGRIEWERRVESERRVATGGSGIRFQTANFNG